MMCCLSTLGSAGAILSSAPSSRISTIADRAGRFGAALSPVAGADYSSGMKITRLKRGYRISVNDVEFDALSLLIEYGMEAYAEQGDEFLAAASTAAKRAFKGRFAFREPLEVDEDRRRRRHGR